MTRVYAALIALALSFAAGWWVCGLVEAKKDNIALTSEIERRKAVENEIAKLRADYDAQTIEAVKEPISVPVALPQSRVERVLQIGQ